MHSLISEIRAAKHPSCKQLICSGAPARRGLGSGALYLGKFAKASISKPSDVTCLSSDGFFFTFLLDIFLTLSCLGKFDIYCVRNFYSLLKFNWKIAKP